MRSPRERQKELQWGRTLSSAERDDIWAGDELDEERFNGAALFQVRKVDETAVRELQQAASFNGAALFQVRKEATTGNSGEKSTLLQWGRTLSSAESSSYERNSIAGSSLQWGRTLSSAERPNNDKSACLPSKASMGPHSFKCGKLALLPMQRTLQLVLQWGRTLSSAERAKKKEKKRK